MKSLNYLSLLLSMMMCLVSCLDDDDLEHTDSPMGNFQACWQAMDEHYCFFEEKQVDWDEVYLRYHTYFADSLPDMVETFFLLGDMLSEVRDGHVNLYSPFNVARYWAWYEAYPDNFDENLLRTYYLGTNYWIAGGMKYGMFSDSVAYVRYESFADTPGETNLDYLLVALSTAKGLIFDIRHNGGGALTNVVTIANRFASSKTCYGYMMHKTGPGHRDFSDPEPLYLEPQADRIAWDAVNQPVVVLVNRRTYSAANNFVAAMKALAGKEGKQIIVMGDKTGGGGGMPFSTVLPNGWMLRFSACPILDHQKQQTEEGIEPDIYVAMDSLSAYEYHRDDIIEAARSYIDQHTKMVYEPENDITTSKKR